MATILVVDDELGIRALLSEILSDEGHTVELAENAAQARAARERFRPDLVLLDIWMPDVDGVTLLKEWATGGLLTMPVVMMSGHGTIDTAVEATKVGAQAFLEKPITLQKLLRAVEQALAKPGPRPGTGGATLSATMGGGGTSALPPSRDAVAGGGHEALAHAATAAHAAGPHARQSFELDRPLREARDAFEKSYFEFHLAQENGSMTRVAEKTGLERTHLYRKLKQLGVDLSRNKRSGPASSG
jgi:DNA-binding NtrC family response regulator